MATGDSSQKAACLKLIEVLDEAKESYVKAGKMAGKINWRDKSKEPSLEVSRAYAKAVEIYSRAVHIIEADSLKNLSERLAFLAYYEYGMSLHWKVHFATRRDYDAMTEELSNDSCKSLLMLQQALKIASNNQLNLLDQESQACGIVAEELEEQGNFEEAYDLFQRMFSIYEKLDVDNVCILGLGTRMVSCFQAAQDESNVDANWLSEKAPTAIACLEKIYNMCDLALKGDKDSLARFSRLDLNYEDCEAYLKQEKDTAKKEIEALKASYPDTDTALTGKKSRPADTDGDTVMEHVD